MTCRICVNSVGYGAAAMTQSLLETLQDPASAALFFTTVALSFGVFYFFFGRDTRSPLKDMPPPPTPRNYTLQQIKEFNGEEGKPIYVAVDGEIFDVSSKANFYGKDGVYSIFAGRDATKAFAKNSLDEADLDVTDLSDLTYTEHESLHGWKEKFKFYSCYPVVGKLIRPKSDTVYTAETLKPLNGTQPVPEGYVDAPILIAIKDKVYDMSFGGVDFYGPGKPYNFLAGKDGARALAKMSFDAADAASRDLRDLDERQLKTLTEWETKLGAKYPVVGSYPY